ncbi:MAG: urease accessory protein UreD [Alphaproteobacteria bacterium]|nr:urease accessory protein UreD [Alphaproteobacteria bacterium]
MRYEARADGRTAVADLHQSAPCRALLPASEDWPTAVFATTCGGLTGGDAVRFDFAVGAHAAARATTQAAERLYKARAADGPARVESHVRLGQDARAEWLPQETIVFDGARLQRRTVFELAAGADLLACELRVLGRAAHGEVFRDGFVGDRIEVWREGRLAWVDALRLGTPSGATDGSDVRDRTTASPEARSAVRGLRETGSERDPGSPRRGVRESSGVGRALASPAGFGGHPAIATVFHAAPDAEARLTEARALLDRTPETVRAAATALDGLLVVRFLAPDAFLLRQSVARFVTGFRVHVGRAPVMPRFWSL